MKIFKIIIIYVCMTILLLMTMCCNYSYADIHKRCDLKTFPVSQDSAPVIIVGAGLTGLIAAYQLHKAGISTLVLEANNGIGGRVNTIYYPDNATAEAHMEEYWAHTPHYRLLREFKLPLVERCPHASVVIDGKVLPHNGKCGKEYFAGMFNTEEMRAFKKWNDKTWGIYNQLHATYYHDQALPPNLQAFTKINFADYVNRAHLPKKVSEWIRVTLEPEISVDWDMISALDGIDEMRIFLESPAGYGESNFHVVGGNANYINALADQLPKKTIRTEARVIKVLQTKDHVFVTYLGRDGSAHTVKALFAIVAVPLFAIHKITFIPALPSEKTKAIATTRFASYVKIHYRVKPEATKLWSRYSKNGLFTLIANTPVGSIYNATDFEEQLSPKDDLIITLLIHGQTAKTWSTLPPEKILKLAKAEMNNLFPGFTKYITSMQVHAYPTAIAYWPFVLSRSRFDHLAIELRKPFGRIQLGGDTTENSHSEGAAIAALRMSGVLSHSCKGQS